MDKDVKVDSAVEDTTGRTTENEAEDVMDEISADAIEDAEEGAVEDGSDSVGENNTPEKKPKYKRRLPISLLACLLGLVLGLIPPILGTLVFNEILHPLFIVAPLLMYLFNSIFKGSRDTRAVIVTAVFSLASAYLTALSCYAVLYTKYYDISIFQIPSVTMSALGWPSILPESASAYVYPLIFTALGFVIAALLLRGKVSHRRNEDGDPQSANNSVQCMDEDTPQDNAADESI